MIYITTRDEEPDIEIVETDGIKLENPLLLLGFPSPGLVGIIALNHIIKELNLREIGYINSKYIPPAVVFLKGQLKHPFRIYANTKGNVCAITCEIPLKQNGIYPITSSLLDWAENHNAKELIILDGIPVRGIPRDRKALCFADPTKLKECDTSAVAESSMGIIRGIAGSILNACLTRKIAGLTLLTPTVAYIPDPKGAAVLINGLNDLYGLGINTQDLLAKAKKIKQQLKDIAKIHKKLNGNAKKGAVPKGMYG